MKVLAQSRFWKLFEWGRNIVLCWGTEDPYAASSYPVELADIPDLIRGLVAHMEENNSPKDPIDWKFIREHLELPE